MGALFRIILIFVIVYYVFKLLGRYLFPYMVKNQVEKMQEKQARSHRDYANQRKAQEGKVTIDYNTKKNKQKRDNDQPGEYVDYEEV
jgi:hypothetical protein